MIVLVALLVCLIPTTIGALLSAIGIAGHGPPRAAQRARDVRPRGRGGGRLSTLLLDKTGTITLGNRQAAEFLPLPGVTEQRARRRGAALEPRRRDAGGPLDRRAREGALRPRASATCTARARAVHRADPDERHRPRRPLDPQGRGRRGRAAGSRSRAAPCPPSSTPSSTGSPRRGGTPLVVAENGRALGVIHLKDIVKAGMRERFDELRRDGHPHGDDHRRQPAHREGDRRRGRRRRLPRRGDARGQDGADQARAGGRPPRRDDRRRHERRARRSRRPTSAWR